MGVRKGKMERSTAEPRLMDERLMMIVVDDFGRDDVWRGGG